MAGFLLSNFYHLSLDLTLLNLFYFSQDEQRHIYNSFLTAHFIPSASASSTQIVTEDVLSSRVIRQREREEELKKLIDSLVTITVEVQENLRSMFLPTPSRSHYIFTLNNLGTIFRFIFLIFFHLSFHFIINTALTPFSLRKMNGCRA